MRTSSELNSVKRSNLLQTQKIFVECTTASKKLYDQSRNTSFLNSSTHTKKKQMDKWVEHYLNMYSRQNNVSPEAFDSLDCLQTMDEINSVSTIGELSSVIYHLTNAKHQYLIIYHLIWSRHASLPCCYHCMKFSANSAMKVLRTTTNTLWNCFSAASQTVFRHSGRRCIHAYMNRRQTVPTPLVWKQRQKYKIQW